MTSQGQDRSVDVYGCRLESSPPQVRLLTIEPAPYSDDDPIKLVAYRFNLYSAPKYVALSYVWGDPSVTHEVVLNGQPVDVTINLFAALRALRRRTDIWFIWIDALSINQRDTVEKSGQLPLMGHIYSRASVVVSWLGESSATSHDAFDFVKEWTNAENNVRIGSQDANLLVDTINILKNPFNDFGWKAIRDLLNRQYWRRLWICQEFYATSVMMLCGDQELSGNDLLQAVRIWGNVISNTFETSLLTSEAEKELIKLCNLDFFQRTVQERARPLAYRTPYADRPSDIGRLIEAMFATCNFQTTDPRDKVFALVAFLELSNIPLRQDYSISRNELYRDLMLQALEDRGLSELTMIAYAGTGHGLNRKTDLPSWVADFEGPHPYLEEYVRVDKAILRYWRTPTPWTLQTRGILVDEITAISRPDTNDIKRLWKWCLFAASVRRGRTESGGVPWRVALYRTLTRSTFEDAEAYARTQKGVYLTGFIRALRHVFRKYEVTPWFTENTRPGQEYEEKQCVDLPSALAVEKEALFWSRDSRIIIEEQFSGYSKWHDETRWGEQYTRSEDHHFWERFNNPITKERAFFVTEKGYMGLAPIGTRQGDQVAVLLGCRVPLVVRKQQDLFELVGDTYVCGLMEGQVMDRIRTEPSILQYLVFR